MKTFIISAVISIIWISMQGKNYLKTIPVGLPNTQAQSGLLKELPKQEISRLPETSAADLKELGMDKDALSYEVVSPIISLQEKLDKTSRKADSMPTQWNKVKGSAKVYFKIFNKNALGIFALLCSTFAFLWLLKSWAILKYLSDIFFDLSRLVLFIVSITSFVIAYYFHLNIWDHAVFFLFPTGVLCLSAFGLWLCDNNFPLWKRLYSSFILPFISSSSLGFFF